MRPDFEVSLDLLNIEFGKCKNLREFSIFELTITPYLLTSLIYNVACSVRKVPLIRNSSAKEVNRTLARTLWADFTILIFSDNAHHILNVETFTLVIK